MLPIVKMMSLVINAGMATRPISELSNFIFVKLSTRLAKEGNELIEQMENTYKNFSSLSLAIRIRLNVSSIDTNGTTMLDNPMTTTLLLDYFNKPRSIFILII